MVNPPAGFIVSANNDPTGNTFDNNVLNQVRPGGGISYLSHAHNGFRAGRITDMVRAAVAKGRVTAADVVEHAGRHDRHRRAVLHPAHHRRVRPGQAQCHTAAGRARRTTRASSRRSAGSSRWNHSYPTGIPEGYDAQRPRRRLGPPTQARDRQQRGRHDLRAVARPVRRQRARPARPGRSRGSCRCPATTTRCKALRQLIVDFDTRKGVGRSGIDFFAVPGIADAADRRDFLMLKSLG